MDYKKLRSKIHEKYNRVIRVQISGRTETIAMHIDGIDNVDYALVINECDGIVAIWDIRQSRKDDCKHNANLNCNISWEEAMTKVTSEFFATTKNVIDYNYKEIHKEYYRENVYFMNSTYIDENYEDFYGFMEFVKYGNNEDLYEDSANYKIKSQGNGKIVCIREKEQIERYKRSADFRYKQLRRFDNKCMVCRCESIELLEAAHIVAVADGGDDSAENGICLCANHHKMFDKNLIKFDADFKKIIEVKEVIKKMPWYHEFNTKYHGKCLQPINTN